MTEFKLFQKDFPNDKEYVNFIFTQRDDNMLYCFLTDYNLNASMPLHNATRKKKVKSWNKITPLNKKFIGIVEDNTPSNIIISIAFIDKESDSYKSFEKDSIMNNSLKNMFIKYSHKFNQNMKELWETYIYPLDIKKNPSDKLFKYVKENLDQIKDDNLRHFIKNQIDE